MAQIQSAGVTDVGQKRKGNEDSFFLDEEMRLFVVADGMGGHAAGEVASKLVVDTIHSFFNKFKDSSAGDELPIIDKSLSHVSNLLLNAIHMANRVVYQTAQKKVAYHGMGSTVSAVYVGDDKLSIANVGDSPIYLARGDSIETVSTPHTMMAEYEELSPGSAKKLGDHLSHVLTRAMGLKDRVEPDATEIPLSGDDIIVICSDGLSDKATPEDIREVLHYERPERAVNTLVKLANDRGGDDNITVIVLHITGSDAESKGSDAESTPAPPPQKTAPGGRITVNWDTDESSHRTFVEEVRPDGLHIETTEAISVGEEIFLTFNSENSDAFSLSGKVADRSPSGIDITYEGLTEEQRGQLASLIKTSGK